MTQKINRFESGHGATEYILPAALIGVVVFVSVLGLQQVLPSYLRGTVGNDAALAAQNGSTGQTPNHSLSESAVGVKPLGIYTRIHVKPESQGYLAEYKKEIEAIGSDGVTEKLLAAMNRYIDELLALGDITEAQHFELQKLSNQGHHLARIQSAIEQLAKQSAASGKPLGAQKVEFDGKTIGIHTLTAMSVINNDETASRQVSAVYTPTNKISAEMKAAFGLDPNLQYIGTPVFEFIQQYEKALSIGEMSDPTTQATIRALARDIQQLSHNTGMAAADVYHRGADPALFNKSIASKTSHSNAGEICTIGNHQDEGIFCSP